MIRAGEPIRATRRRRLRQARLYLIIDTGPGGRPADAVVEPALEGGVDMVQLRDKSVGDEVIVGTGRRLRRLCDEHRALLVINDRPDLALDCAADGVHLGQEDAPVETVRAVVGDDVLIGVSTHSPEQVDAARASTADYLGVGPVYETATKPDVEPVGEALVRYAVRAAGKPFFAIGGIDAAGARAVAAAGAERIAVVRALRDSDDPREAARELRSALALEAGVG